MHYFVYVLIYSIKSYIPRSTELQCSFKKKKCELVYIGDSDRNVLRLLLLMNFYFCSPDLVYTYILFYIVDIYTTPRIECRGTGTALPPYTFANIRLV